MNNVNMKKISKIYACALLASLALLLIFTVCEIGHECSGEDCEICRIALFCRDLMRYHLAVCAVLWAINVAMRAAMSVASRVWDAKISPISLGVKLLN